MIVGVTGGRKYSASHVVWRVLDDLHNGPNGPITDLIHGLANGVDSFADQWARARRTKARWIRIHAFAPKYDMYGSSLAPKVRNQQMIDEGPVPDKCLEFLGGTGTADMVERWRKAGYGDRISEVSGDGVLHDKSWRGEEEDPES